MDNSSQEILDKYNKAQKALLSLLGFNLRESFAIIDCTMFYWHLGADVSNRSIIYYSKNQDNVNDEFTDHLAKKSTYPSRVFGGQGLTGLLLGKEVDIYLGIFMNSKYTGNQKEEKKFI